MRSLRIKAVCWHFAVEDCGCCFSSQSRESECGKWGMMLKFGSGRNCVWMIWRTFSEENDLIENKGFNALGSSLHRMSTRPHMPFVSNSHAIRQEIQRFESVHPSIYAIYDLIEHVQDPGLAQQIREHVVCIEGKWQNHLGKLRGGDLKIDQSKNRSIMGGALPLYGHTIYFLIVFCTLPHSNVW